MLKEISKKLTMKKTFFATQLEGFFNSISQEYQELIQEKEVENTILKEQNNTLQKDITNLIEIKNDLLSKLTMEKKHVNALEEELLALKNSNDQDMHHKIFDENKILKEKLSQIEDSNAAGMELHALRDKVKKLQDIIAKGANAYNDNMSNQNKEALIEEINKNLKK